MKRYTCHVRIVVMSLLAGALVGCSSPPLRLLIIDGQNNHDWETMTRIMRPALVETGRFDVDVATTPPKGAPASDWDAFRPDFARYDVVLSNYNDRIPRAPGDRWPAEVETALEAFVRNGGGLVIIHAANNAFPHWPEWNRMIGLGWRHKGFGDRIALDDEGNVIRTPKGEGLDASHGTVHAYRITVRAPDHPVMKGMPLEWMHAEDELYHAQRGPGLDMHILASAYSSPEERGTGVHEPMVWAMPYGEGRVFTTVMGHVMQEATAIRCIGFQAVMCRGAEWAATGHVTIPVPAGFPAADHVSVADERESSKLSDSG